MLTKLYKSQRDEEDLSINEQHPQEGNGLLYTEEDIKTGIKGCNFKKAIYPDGFDGLILEKAETMRKKVILEVTQALNNNRVPDHLKLARLVSLSKKGIRYNKNQRNKTHISEVPFMQENGDTHTEQNLQDLVQNPGMPLLLKRLL